MDILLYLLIALFLLYFFTNIVMWKGLSICNSPISNEIKDFSVIIAARNEEKTIRECLLSLIEQDYPKDRYEIIVANDRSTDATKEIVTQLASISSTLKLIDINASSGNMPSKKFALSKAIEHSRNEFLVFTDADCIAEKNWLQTISNAYTNNVGAVAGYSPNILSETKNIFAKSFLHFEELYNSILAAAAIGVKNAYMCTGRSFSYRKSLYLQVAGFEKIKHSISGDDDLFLQVLQKETNAEIRYIAGKRCNVLTFPPKSFSQFVNQRTRHVSASKYYPTKIKFFYLISHLVTLASLLAPFIIPLYGLIFFLLKINIDAITISKSEKYFNEKISFLNFVLGNILIMLYTVSIAPLGYFFNFSWKGSASH